MDAIPNSDANEIFTCNNTLICNLSKYLNTEFDNIVRFRSMIETEVHSALGVGLTN